MALHKDLNGNIHDDMDGAAIHLLPQGCVEITDEEAEALRQHPQETPEQIIARLEGAIDRYLDAQAQSFRYESIRTMVTYENDPNTKFNAEGVGAKAFRSAVYTLGVSLIGEVQSGMREVPTEEELIAELPRITDFINV